MDFTQTITDQQIDQFIEQALTEDVRDGDHTSLACIPPGARTRSKLLIKDAGVVAGVELAKHIFKKVDPNSNCLLYTSPSPRDATLSRMPSSA